MWFSNDCSAKRRDSIGNKCRPPDLKLRPRDFCCQLYFQRGRHLLQIAISLNAFRQNSGHVARLVLSDQIQIDTVNFHAHIFSTQTENDHKFVEEATKRIRSIWLLSDIRVAGLLSSYTVSSAACVFETQNTLYQQLKF